MIRLGRLRLDKYKLIAHTHTRRSMAGRAVFQGVSTLSATDCNPKQHIVQCVIEYGQQEQMSRGASVSGHTLP